MRKDMKVLCISGSPRKNGNTEWLLKTLLSKMDGRLIRLTDYSIAHCHACWGCLKRGRCRIEDDMTTSVVPLLLDCDAVVLGSPVFSTTFPRT